jgi:hypothetical protein
MGVYRVRRTLAHTAALTALLMQQAAAQSPVPELRYDPPPNFYHSAIRPPDDYTGNEFKADLQVYPFRPFTGDIEQAFRHTLLREWIDPRYQERGVAGAPEFRQITIRGAQKAISARFTENLPGMPKPRQRILIVAGNSAAIVDASAPNPQLWQRALPAFNAVATSMHVEAGTPPPNMAAPIGPEGRAVAGLYQGTKAKYMVNLNAPVGYGSQVMAPHYYLFSADGRVHRAYDGINVPGGDVRRFDFDAAQRADPVNSGRYAIRGNELYIRMGEGQTPEIITVPKPQGGRVTINTREYTKQ